MRYDRGTKNVPIPEVIPIAEYMNPDTKLPPYLPLPRFLLKADLSMTAMIVYSLLLYRMMLSQRNGWADEDGHSYVIYPVEHIAEDIGRSLSPVKSALTELSAKGLIEKKRPTFSEPNRIYVLLPDSLKTDCMTDGNPPLIEPENRPYDGLKTDCMTVGNQPPNKKSINKENNNKKNRASTRAFGRYENVFLTEDEYAALKAENPGIDSLIEQLSAYMKSEGRRYADHAATLRLWMARDKGKNTTNKKIPDYTPKEGESL